MRTLPNKRLKMALFDRGITQRELAFYAGVNEGRLSRIVRGYELPTDEIRRNVADFLGVKEAAIF